MIAALEEAELKCLKRQEYGIGSRRLRSAELDKIQDCLEKWRNTPTAEDLQSGHTGLRFTPLVPCRGRHGGY